jgi:serine/threonine protein kinase
MVASPDTWRGPDQALDEAPTLRDHPVVDPEEPYGRYIVERQIGAGRMGIVYEAFDPLLSRRVAVKVLTREFAADGDALPPRLLREAKALARLAHPNVVVVHDVGKARGRLFLAMDYVDGTTLDEWVLREARSWKDVLEVYLQAARGLAAAHEAGVVHRDFKPANVLVSREGRAYVTDFGLARIARDDALEETVAGDVWDEDAADSTRTLDGALVGSPAYMAPEVMRGAVADAQSDLFSFAVSLWRALYGMRPFVGSSLRDLHDAVVESRLVPVPGEATVPSGVRDIVLGGLRASPRERPPGMRALIAELEREMTLDGLSRANRILEEARAFFHPQEQARGVSTLALSLIEHAVAGETPAPEIYRPDLPYLSEVEISGSRLQYFNTHLWPYRTMMGHLLSRLGFPADADGVVRFDPERWYPFTLVLLFSRLETIAAGPRAEYEVGRAYAQGLLETETLPSGMSLLEFLRAVQASTDSRFRLRGKTLDQVEPPLADAAGFARFEDRGPGRVEITMNYASRCEASRGTFATLAQHVHPDAVVEHLEGPCRDRGDTECRYAVRWGGI